MTLTEPEAKRFWGKVSPTGFCWDWTGSLNDGYGRFSPRKSKTLIAHRVAYSLLIGATPPLLDHLCRNRRCVNPDHLVPKSNRANVLEGFGITARNARKDACDAGHEFTPENTTVDRFGYRRCRECRRGYDRVRYARDGAARGAARVRSGKAEA